MSHQKTKRIQSPLRNKFGALNLQVQENSLFNSRMTQKRRPIFNDSSKKQGSPSNSMRRKIFSSTDKSQQKLSITHFSRLIQAQKPTISKDQQYSGSIQSSQQQNVQQTSNQSIRLLDDVKKQLFPQTPIRKSHPKDMGLQQQRKFTHNSCKKEISQSKLLTPINTLESDDPQTPYLQKTALKMSNTKWQKSYDKNIKQQSKTTYYSLSQEKGKPVIPQSFKSIALQLRQLHTKMLSHKNTQDQPVYSNQQKNLIFQQDGKLKQVQQQNQILSKQNLQYKRQIFKAKSILATFIRIQQHQGKDNISNLNSMLNQLMKVLEL